MGYIIALAVFAFLAFFIFYRDRQYLKKNLKDVMSVEVKKMVNLPTGDEIFPQRVDSQPSSTLAKKASQRILVEINQIPVVQSDKTHVESKDGFA